MIYKPTAFLKKHTLFAFFLLPVIVSAQSIEDQQAAADSLFRQKQYTQAFSVYRAIEQQGFFSEAMLLRMAFIQDGLGNAAESLFYLNRLWLHTGDELTREKIQELAQKQKLYGHDYPLHDRLRQALFGYRHTILWGGVSACIFLLAVSFFLVHKKLAGRKVFPVFTLLSALVLGGLVYYSAPPAFGITNGEAVYLMTGPSGGSSVLVRIGKGHRIPLLGSEDVWVKTLWKGTRAYVRQSAVVPI